MTFSPELAAAHRRRLAASLKPGDLLLLPAARQTVRNNDVHHRFRQDSDFYYLTAFPEPDALALIKVTEEGLCLHLFVAPRDPSREVWDGKRAGIEGAIERYGADQAYDLTALDEKIPELLDGAERLIYAMENRSLVRRLNGWRKKVMAKVRQGASFPSVAVQLSSILSEQRLIKDADELELMERAAQISVAAHLAAMTAGVPGTTESELEGMIEARFRSAGAKRFAYPSIVASGANGCVLHYVDNDAAIEDGDTLLIDAGCEFAGYAADITVTWPANGRFTESQRRVYDAVFRVQLSVIDAVRPGATFKQLNALAYHLLVAEMQQLGLLDQSETVDALVEAKAYRPYYMHGIGHWLGMDVHDVGGYGKKMNRPFEPGMVLTVEPGIYISPDAEAAPEGLRGIAVRIEDDIVVTEGAPRILSHGLPRSSAAIEAYLAANR
jgi:Xaa-Pro aminopeptidase